MLNNNISSFQKELEGVLQNLGVFKFHPEDSDQLLSAIKYTYVNGNPRAWWLSLNHKQKTFTYSDNSGYKHIKKIIKKLHGNKKIDDVFFIADDDEMLIYRIPLDSLEKIVENSIFFEYYVVANDLSWLVCENDHGDIIVCSHKQ